MKTSSFDLPPSAIFCIQIAKTIYFAGLALIGGPIFAETAKPNIIIILSDDHGYTDLGIHGIEENTIIFFAGDNGAQPKYMANLKGKGTLAKWDGSENVPLRGEKGSLWEGGMKVPMFAYWKGHIVPGQVIESPVSTLDFTASALKLAGGAIPTNGKSPLRGIDRLKKATIYIDGAPPNTPADPRYLHPYKDGKPSAYPAPLKAVP